MRIRPWPFVTGLFLLCMSTLLLQIAQTRLLSVVGRYYLAFFAISIAMFGMTAGALWVYKRGAQYVTDALTAALARISLIYALAIVLCAGFEFASVAIFFSTAVITFVWLKMILLLAPPFFFAGMAISLALTRSPFPIGFVYGVDLAGAACGCLIAVVLLNLIDTPSALLGIAAIAALAATCFATAHYGSQQGVGWSRASPRVAALTAGILVLLCVGNSLTTRGLQPMFVKGQLEDLSQYEFIKWNTYSRVVASYPQVEYPSLWGPSPIAPKDMQIEQRSLAIDGDAATSMPRFAGDLQTLSFLNYDITTLGYTLRNHGRAAVIGVGGGRDLLSAHYFGFRDLTGADSSMRWPPVLI
jgi:hypothetical protein